MMKFLPKLFLAIFVLSAPLFTNVDSAFAGCNALGCATDGDCDSSGTVCGSDPASCAIDCSNACTDPSDPTKTIPGTAVITGTSCNLCDYDVTCGTCDCGGGGGGPSGGALNGVVFATDTLKRWVQSPLTCNQSYLGVSVKAYDESGAFTSNGGFNCNTECSNCDGNGHFDIFGIVEANKELSVILTIPAGGYSCSSASWAVTDRNDLGNPSDNVIIGGGNGCEASFIPDNNVFDWRYGITFFMNTIDNDPPSNPGDPVTAACIPINGGIMPITFTASTDNDSGLSHYVVNVDEDNNNSSNFSVACSDVNNSGDVCISTTSTSINYSFHDDKIYRIWIDAFDNAGNKSSSSEVIYLPKTAPPSPSSVDATDGLVSKINISWVDNSNQTYNSETSFDVIKDGNVIGSVSPNIVAYSDANDLCDGSNHSYNISAVNSCGSNLSAPANAGSCVTLYDNAWWQVFNGGVHSNGGIVLDGVPSADFVIGDGLAVDHPFIVGESVSTFNGYGLVSSVSGPIDISNGDAGIAGHDFFTESTTMDMENVATPEFFDEIRAVGSAWNAEPTAEPTTALSSIGSSTSPSYFERNSSDTINSIISYNENKVVAVIFTPSTGTLTLRKDIVDTSYDKDKFLVLFVDGNVLIDSSVLSIDAFIFASGKITVESKGTNLDNQVLIKGGLYGHEVVLNRDLRNIVVNNNKPAELILYNHNLMLNQQDIPLEVKETPIIWVLED